MSLAVGLSGRLLGLFGAVFPFKVLPLMSSSVRLPFVLVVAVVDVVCAAWQVTLCIASFFCRLCSLLPSFYCVRSICLYIHAQHNFSEFERVIKDYLKLSISAKQNVYKSLYVL